MGSELHEKSRTIQFEQNNNHLQYNTDSGMRSAGSTGKIIASKLQYGLCTLFGF